MSTRPGKEFKIGHDKRPAPLINTEQPLFNIRTGRKLTDAGGTPLVSAEDQFLLSEATSDKSTPITFNTDPDRVVVRRSKIAGDEFSVFSPQIVPWSDGTVVSEFSFVSSNGNIYVVTSSGSSQILSGSNPTHLTGDATINGVTYGFLKEGVDPFFVLQSVNSSFNRQLRGGDIVFLPTGFSNGEKFYQERTIEGVFNNTIAILKTAPDTSNTLFTVLEKKISLKQTSTWKVEEQFPVESEVSRSILGVPKAEEQLSLFADVSSYGQDDTRFVSFRDDGGTNQPREWRTRKSERYGNHYRSRLREEKEESAIVLEAFPTPYSYPYGPRFASDGLYDEVKYGFWNNFLKLGTILYTYFSDPNNYGSNPNFRNKFLPFSDATLDYTQSDFFEYFSEDLDFTSFYNNAEEFFAQIDIWTETWRDIQLDALNRPSGGVLDAEWINGLGVVQGNLPENVFPTLTAPGYGTNFGSFIFLQSRKAFRYQPGRISGYTFGVRTSNDATDSNTITEWGIGNTTDQLVFQVRGSSFNIVRRSTIPLSDSVLESMNLSSADQKLITISPPQRSPNPEDENLQQYETVISSDFWNGDPLDGTGNSRYSAILNRVTMYKIEFGWYGAIGIQFYAFIPVENDEARWVKLHRILIENQLDQPDMGDPYYRFIFSLRIKDNISLRSPQFIYKYGTSCYIDGGDEGTVEVYSDSSDLTAISPSRDTTLLGIYPKDVILNSTGTEIINKKTIIPQRLSLSADDLTQVQVVKCNGCPGFAQNYSPNLDTGVNGIERIFNFVPTGGGSFSSSQVELRLLNKEVDGVVSSGSTEITFTDVDNLRIGDHIPQASYFQENTVITNINSNTVTIDLSTIAEIPDGTTLEVQPLFQTYDYFGKLIRDGFWNVYLGEFSSEVAGGYTTALLDGWAADRGDEPYGSPFLKYSETEEGVRVIPDSVKSGGSFIIPKENWTARISQYGAIAASSVPISGRVNELLFLQANPKDSFNNIADFKLGVTNLRPLTNAAPGAALADLTGFETLTGDIVDELPPEAKLEAEWATEGVGKDRNGYEVGDTRFSRIPPFEYDYRISNPPGSNSGSCSYVTVSVQDPQEIAVDQLLGDNLNLGLDDINNDPEYDPTATYLRPSAGGSFNFGFEPIGGEVAFNSVQQDLVPENGTGEKFSSLVRTYTDFSGETPITYEYVKITNPVKAQSQLVEPIVIWFTAVEMRSYRILRKKAFNFKPFPLYFYIDGRDNARVNSIVITEQTEVKSTYNPRWYTSEGISVDAGTSIQVGPIGNTTTTSGDITLPPANFQEMERLSSASIDTQNLNQLRPYTVIDTFYVANQTKEIDLTSIFDFEKEIITPDLLNTEAVFFVARSKSGSDTNVQSTVTFIEQQ